MIAFNNNLNMSTIVHLTTILLFLSICGTISNSSVTTVTTSYSDDVTPTNADTSEEESTELSAENTKTLGNLSIVLKMATECTTPNRDIGYCVEIKVCSILLNQLNNENAKKFVTDSKCGPDNEDKTNPKVCCGKHGNYKTLGTNHKRVATKTVINVNKRPEAETKRKNHRVHEKKAKVFNNDPENGGATKSKIENSKVFPKICGKQRLYMRGRIFGGSKAVLGEFPWLARLLHKNDYGDRNYGCAAFLIHTKYVLTAGHCVHKKFTVARGPVFSVVLGEHDIESQTDCVSGVCADPLQISKVAEVIIHPKYDPENDRAHYNDITLIRLKKAARTTDFVSPICLNTDPSFTPKEYILSGWGKTETQQISSIKMKVDLPAVERSVCNEQYILMNITLKEIQICAGGEDGKDSCNGDSGGPLMYFGEDNSWFAAGIVSFGIGCGAEGWPGVYTNIGEYIPWIRKTILAKSKKRQPKTIVAAKT